MSTFQILIYGLCGLIGLLTAFLIHGLGGEGLFAAMLIGASSTMLSCGIGESLGESKRR